MSRWSYAEGLKEESIKDTYLLLRNAKGLKKKKWGNTWAGEITLVGKKKKIKVADRYEIIFLGGLEEKMYSQLYN